MRTMIILAPGGVVVWVCARVHVSRRVIGLNKTQFHFPGVNNLAKLKTDTKIGHHISEVANPAPRRIGQASGTG